MTNGASKQKTVQLLSLIAEHPTLSQREMAKQTGLSLGLVNLILKRLLQTGHIKISNLNKKKMRYWLTPRGFVEKANHSYDYLVKTVSVFMTYKQRVDTIVDAMAAQGHGRFAILGDGEIARLVEYSLRNRAQPLPYRYVSEEEPARAGELLFDCRLKGKKASPTGVRMLSALLDEKYKPARPEALSL